MKASDKPTDYLNTEKGKLKCEICGASSFKSKEDAIEHIKNDHSATVVEEDFSGSESDADIKEEESSETEGSSGVDSSDLDSSEGENEDLDNEDADVLKQMIQKHFDNTRSTVAKFVLGDFENQLKNFVKVFPKDYKKALKKPPVSAAAEELRQK